MTLPLTPRHRSTSITASTSPSSTSRSRSHSPPLSPPTSPSTAPPLLSRHLPHLTLLNHFSVNSINSPSGRLLVLFGLFLLSLLCLGALFVSSTSQRFFSSAAIPPFQSQSLQARLNHLEARLALLQRFHNEEQPNVLKREVKHALSLPTHSHVEHLRHSSFPRNAVFTLITLSHKYCQNLWTLYKSLRLTDPEHDWDFVIMYTQDQDERIFESDRICAALFARSYSALQQRGSELHDEQVHNHSVDLPPSGRVGHIRLMPVPFIQNDTWHTIPERWRYSMHRLEMFRQLDYEHSLYIDADVVAVHSIAPLFDLAYDLAGVVDQYDGCARREVMNGGLLSFKPSLYLYEALIALFHRHPSCLTKTMVFSDQELINCLCGLAGAAKPAAYDIHCGLVPSWAAMYPSDSQCGHFHPDDLILLHYAFHPKPDDEGALSTECIEAAIVEGDPLLRDAQVQKTPHCHELDQNQAFFMFWHCVNNRGSLVIDQDPIKRSCKLIINDNALPKHEATRPLQLQYPYGKRLSDPT